MECNAQQAGFDEARLGRITDHLVKHYVDPGKIAGCQVAVARHGHLAYYASLGSRDLERGLPMSDDTIFRIYSMSKPITSVALMQLYERGMFQLNDPVHRVIPAWRDLKVYVGGEGERIETRPAEQPITFRNILSHTAGLSYGGSDHPVDKTYRALQVRQDGETLRSFVDKLAGAPLHYSPGERWLYSYATDVCGYLVEALSGMPLDRYFESTSSAPSGWSTRHSACPPIRRRGSQRTTSASRTSPSRCSMTRATASTSSMPTFLSGGGGLTGTTADYLRFSEMLRRGGELDGERILGPRTLRLMTQNHLVGGGDLSQVAMGAFSETAYEGVGFGLGFATTLSEVAAGTLGPGDFYWGGAASTIFWVDPVEDLSAVFMTQLMPSATFNFRGQLKNIIYSAIVD